MTSVHIHGFGPNGELSPGAEAALTAWAGPAGGTHDHDTDYYTKAQVDALMSGATPVAAASGLNRALSSGVAALANCDTAVAKVLFLGSSSVSANVFPARMMKRLSWAYQPGATPPVPLLGETPGTISPPATGIYAVNMGVPATSSGNYVGANQIAMAAALQPRLIVHAVGQNNVMGSTPLGTFTGHITAALDALDAELTVPASHLFLWFYSLYPADKPRYADDFIGALIGIANARPGNVAVADLGPYADTLEINGDDPYNYDTGDGLHMSDAGGTVWGDLAATPLLASAPVNYLGWSAPFYGGAADTTDPEWTATFTMGTPTTTSVTAEASAMATDDTAVTGYEVSYNGGADWASITPSGSVFTLAGTAGTTYSTTQLRAVDAAANTSTPLNVPSYTMDTSSDTTDPTAGTLGVVVGSTTADGTVTGATDETALDAAPYSFQVDGGSWSAWQSSASYEWTGLTAETEYDFRHRVRDSSGNISEGAIVTDTTDAAPSGPTTITDSFNRANSTTSLGTTDTGQTWVQNPTGIVGINSNTAYRVSGTAHAAVEFGQPDMLVTITTAGSGSFFRGPSARVSEDWGTYYYVDTSSSTAKFRCFIAGVETALPGASYAFTEGQTLGLSAVDVGADVELKLYIAGSLVSTITDTGMAATFTGTRAGVRPMSSSTSRFDTFTVEAP